MLEDREPHAPVLVARELLDRRQQRLREQVDADDAVDLVELRDHVEAHVREGVLQQREEDGQQVVDRRLAPELRRELHRDARERGAHELAAVVRELLDARRDLRDDDRRREHLGEGRDLAGRRDAHLRLGVAQQLDERRREVGARGLGAERLAERDELLRDVVAHAPRLVGGELLHHGQQARAAAVGAERARERAARLDGEQAHAVLLVGGQVGEQRQELARRVLALDGARKGAEPLRRRAPHHGRLVVAELPVQLPQLGARRGGRACVGRREEAARRHARREPLALREALLCFFLQAVCRRWR